MKARLLNHRSSLISVAVLVLFFVFVASFLTAPLFNQYEKYQLEMAKDARLLQQLGAVVESKEELQQAYQAFETQKLSSWLYRLGDFSAVALDVQRRVSAEIAKNSAQLRTISPMPPRRKDDYFLVGVQVHFSSSLEGLIKILAVLEEDKPLLAIEKLRLSPIVSRVRQGEQDVQLLDVQMTVTTFVQTDLSQGSSL